MTDLGEEWMILNEYKEGNERIGLAELQSAVKNVSQIVLKNGLTSNCIETLVSVIEKLHSENVDYSMCLQILQLMIPNEPIRDQCVIRLITWFQTRYQTNHEVHHYFTYWLLVCLKTGLVNKQVVQNHFKSLIFLFLQNVHNDGLSHILVEVSKKDSISVKLLRQMVDKYKRTEDPVHKKQLSVLIHHGFKTLPQHDTSQIKININRLVKPHVADVKDKYLSYCLNRIILKNTAKEDKLNLSKILYNETGIKEELDCYFGLTPVYLKDIKGSKITELTKDEEVIKYYDKIIVPLNILALLQCKCAPMFVRFIDKSFRDDLEEQISCILNGILNSQLHPAIKNDKFLKALQEVQFSTKESLVSVSTFLKNYFIIWDGLKYRNEVIGLISWLQFDSHNDLFDTMKSLLNVYATVDLDCRSQILEALSSLYVNMMITINTKIKHKLRCRNELPSWMKTDAEKTLNYYISMFEKFVGIGLIYHGNGSGFLIAALRSYIKILVCQEKYNFLVLDDVYSCYNLTVVPVSLVLMAQSSNSITVIDILIQLLSIYWESQEKIMSNLEEEYYQEYKNTLSIIETFSRDILTILLDGINGDKLEDMMIGSLVKESDKQEFETLKGFPSRIHHFLSITSNFATSHIVHTLAKKMKIDVSSIKPEKYLDILDYVAPQMSLMIKNKLREIEARRSEEGETLQS